VGSVNIAQPYLTLVLDGGEWPASRPGRFITRERAHGYFWIRGSVAPAANLDNAEKRKYLGPIRNRTQVGQPSPSNFIY
jgi:hypothetical protein